MNPLKRTGRMLAAPLRGEPTIEPEEWVEADQRFAAALVEAGAAFDATVRALVEATGAAERAAVALRTPATPVPKLTDEARAFLDFATDPDAAEWGLHEMEVVEEFHGVG